MHHFISHRNCFAVYAMFTPKQQKDNLDPNDVKCIFEGYLSSKKTVFYFPQRAGKQLITIDVTS